MNGTGNDSKAAARRRFDDIEQTLKTLKLVGTIVTHKLISGGERAIFVDRFFGEIRARWSARITVSRGGHKLSINLSSAELRELVRLLHEADSP